MMSISSQSKMEGTRVFVVLMEYLVKKELYIIISQRDRFYFRWIGDAVFWREIEFNQLSNKV